MNHQGTAATRAVRARACHPAAADGEAEAWEFFDRLAGMSPRWLLTRGQRRRLAPAVAGALAAGWTPDGLAEHVGANTAGIRNPAAVLAVRLSQPELPQPPPRAAERPPWCGRCNEHTSRREDADGADAGRCPECHPLAGRRGHAATSGLRAVPAVRERGGPPAAMMLSEPVHMTGHEQNRGEGVSRRG